MTMRWLESFGDDAYDKFTRFDHAEGGVLEAFRLDSGHEDNFVAPSAACMEFGANRIGTAAKQVPDTDHLVVGFQYTWHEHIAGSSFGASLDIDLETNGQQDIFKIEIEGGGVVAVKLGGAVLGLGGFNNDSTLADGTGYVELVIFRHPTLGSVTLFVDGVQQGTQINLALGNSPIGFVRWGTTFQNPTHEQVSHIFLEDLTGHGTYTAKGVWYITRNPVNTLKESNNWDNPEGVLQGGAGVASAGGVGASIDVNTAGIAGGAAAIYAVQLSYAIAKDGTEPLEYSTHMSMNGTKVTNPPTPIGSLVVRDYYQLMDSDPSDQTPLTEADIATTSGGLIITSRG